MNPMNSQAICSMLVVVLLAPSTRAAETPVKIPEFPHRITCMVTDAAGDKVQDANVAVYRNVIVQLEPEPIVKAALIPFEPTDSEGQTAVSFNAIESPEGVTLEKDGYYPTWLRFDWKRPNPIDQVTPSTTELHATLKKIKNPIPMHASTTLANLEKYTWIPALDREYGYDLMECQAMPPLGKGKVADFYFKVQGAFHSFSHHDLRLQIRFPNPGDGVIEFYTPLRSSMRETRFLGAQLQSDYIAPEDGYKELIERVDIEHPGRSRTPKANQKLNFYFRCRTKKDSSGKILSAHYGKIYGDFDFGHSNPGRGFVAVLGWTCSYFNPTPNDRNVEFDTKRNLNPDFEVSWP